jgi:hypothetical protein
MCTFPRLEGKLLKAPPSFPEAIMKTYQGSCHCRRVRFEIDAEIDHVRSCDCSICSRRGALIYRVPVERFRLLTPLAELTAYRWGSMTGTDYFCPVCGVLPFRRPSDPTPAEVQAGATRFEGWAINTRCLEGFEPASVPVRIVRGSEIEIVPPRV